MSAGDKGYTYNPLSNDDRQLLLAHGYLPGELSAEEAREILEDLRAQVGDDEDSERFSSSVPADELDGTE